MYKGLQGPRLPAGALTSFQYYSLICNFRLNVVMAAARGARFWQVLDARQNWGRMWTVQAEHQPSFKRNHFFLQKNTLGYTWTLCAASALQWSNRSQVWWFNVEESVKKWNCKSENFSNGSRWGVFSWPMVPHWIGNQWDDISKAVTIHKMVQQKQAISWVSE